MSVDTNALRRGFGSAAGISAQLGAYHQACNKAADEIDRLRLEVACEKNRFVGLADNYADDLSRIVALEDAARHGLVALANHSGNYKLTKSEAEKHNAAVAKLDEVLK
jgi:hypothetical protein